MFQLQENEQDNFPSAVAYPDHRTILYEPIEVYKEHPPPANIEKIIMIRWCDKDLQAAQAVSTARTSAQLQNFGTSGHLLIGSVTLFPRDVAQNLVHWLLRQICIHQQCIKCDAAGLDATLSCAHAIDCLGHEPDILAAVPFAALGGVPMDGSIILDEAIRCLPTGPDGRAPAVALARIIRHIQCECAGVCLTQDISAASARDEARSVSH
ncbi:hypothetical protein HK405_010043 [Cladochytrium tenue]|nr:hypothetical protein HK405_010043 [Cladochytrium tenue]